MEQFYAVLDQVLIFFIILIIGFIAVKTKFLNDTFLSAISVFFSRLIVPFLIFVNTVNGATRTEMIENSYLIGIYACTYAVVIPISRITPKLLRLKGNRASLFSLATSFGNVGFIGIPLLLSAFGSRVMIFVAMHAIVDQIIMWTYGVTLTYPAENKPKFRLKTLVNVINPALVAIILAAVLIMLDVKMPKIINQALTSISNAGMALPFLYIGGVLATMDIVKLLKNYDIYAAIVIKMLIIPICVFLVFRAVGIKNEIAIVSTILFGLPVIGVAPMLASSNGSDVNYATALSLLTTPASLFTLTFISYIVTVL